MTLESDKLANDMEKLYETIVMKSNILSLDNFKYNILEKQIYIKEFIQSISNINQGSISKDVIKSMEVVSNEFKELYDNFDDKLMIFIVGDGKVGKSTLLNALVGKEVAKTDYFPTTWKIDVYTPELSEDKAIIKYTTGKKEILNIEEAKHKINQEEKKSKESKKVYNEKLKEQSKNIRNNKEQLEELKIYLDKKYIYKSNISEARWPVKSNWMLDRCLLVDTPGLIQNLNGLEQLGDINSYYHKADGVIWMLDGNTIQKISTDILLKQVEDTLGNVGGLRDNIIGIINRIDLLRENSNEDIVNKICDDTRKYFKDKFTNIIPISAKEAYEGISKKDENMIEQSGIRDLQKAIRNIFLSKADTVKGNAKIQGCNKLVNNTKIILDDYKNKIYDYKKMYISKQENLELDKESLINDIKEDLSTLISNYLTEVNNRVNAYVDELSNGEGIDFIKNIIYKVDEFENMRNLFIKNKKLEIKNNTITWEKLCKINEYKYIQPNPTETYLSININIDFDNIDTSAFFTPSDQGTLMSTLGNLIGKIGFLIRKNKIKYNLIMTIKSQCEKMENELIKKIESVINENYNNCKNILNVTFREILFDFNDIESVKSSIAELETYIDKDAADYDFEEIVGIRGKKEYVKFKN